MPTVIPVRISKKDLAPRRVLVGLLGVIGYILSPASWWNDALINIPLSLLAAKLLALVGVPLRLGFIIAYWATNALGIFLMAWAGSQGLGVRGYKGLILSLLTATAYTIIVVLILGAIGS